MAIKEVKLTEEQYKILRSILEQYSNIEEKLRIVLTFLGIPHYAVFTMRLDEKNMKVIYDDGEVEKKEEK